MVVDAYAAASLPTLLADFGAEPPEWASAAVRHAAPLESAAAPPGSVGGAEVAEAGVADDVVAALAQLLRDGDEDGAELVGVRGVAAADLASSDAAAALAVDLDDDSLPQELIDILQGSGEEGQVLVDVSGVLSMQRVGSAALLAVDFNEVAAAPEEWVLPFTEEDAAVYDVSAEEADALAVDMDEMVELSSAARVASFVVPPYMLVNDLTEAMLAEGEGGDLDELVTPLLRDPALAALVSSLPYLAHGAAPPPLIEPHVDEDELDRLGLSFLRDGEGIAALFPGLAAGDGTIPLLVMAPLPPPPLPLASQPTQLPPALASAPPPMPPPLHAPTKAPAHTVPAAGRAAAPPLLSPPPPLMATTAKMAAPPAAAPPHVPPAALPAVLTTLAPPLRRGLQHASLASLGSVLCVPLTLGIDDPLGFFPFDGTEALGLGLEALPAVATLDAISLGGLSLGFGSASSVVGLPFGPTTFDRLFEACLPCLAISLLPVHPCPACRLSLCRRAPSSSSTDVDLGAGGNRRGDRGKRLGPNDWRSGRPLRWQPLRQHDGQYELPPLRPDARFRSATGGPRDHWLGRARLGGRRHLAALSARPRLNALRGRAAVRPPQVGPARGSRWCAAASQRGHAIAPPFHHTTPHQRRCTATPLHRCTAAAFAPQACATHPHCPLTGTAPPHTPQP